MPLNPLANLLVNVPGLLAASLDPHPDLTPSVIFGLGWVYLILFVMNAAWTFRSAKKDGEFHVPQIFGGGHAPLSAVWAIFSALLLMVAMAHLTGFGQPETFVLRMPGFMKTAVDAFADPISYFTLSMVLFLALLLLRKWWVQPNVAWTLLNASLVFVALSLTDWDFRQIVGKPDNVPIVIMLYLVAFFTWIAFSRAVENDRRIEEGKPLYEVEHQEKVLTWPDLVYTELICMVALTAVLVIWGIALQAPLEEPANSSKTPNPSKAPWYFLGLQEMLVYYDPWMAGVVLPSIILGGLMALPYIDFNKRGNGYYSFKERWFGISTFLFGFLPLWVAMIVLGTFLRGPNWNFFGIYEYWDVHKLEVLNNINLSEYFWGYSYELTGVASPIASVDQSETHNMVVVPLLRELPGIILVLFYLLALPPLLAATVFRTFFQRMGFLRYMVFINLVLFMMSLPLKMVLRWAFQLKYIVAIPEWFFNI